MIRVLIADDHAVVREGLKRIIADLGDMTVAGEAASVPELNAKLAGSRWDVVMMDLAMPGCSGLEALQEIHARCPRLPILVLTMHPEDQYAVRAIMAGASGYLHKGGEPAEIITALRTVATGKRYISAAVAERLAEHVDLVSNKSPHETLSNREFEVLRLIAAGKGMGEIAEGLLLSIKTVSTYRARILEKMGFHSNAELIRYAIQNQLVE